MSLQCIFLFTFWKVENGIIVRPLMTFDQQLNCTVRKNIDHSSKRLSKYEIAIVSETGFATHNSKQLNTVIL